MGVARLRSSIFSEVTGGQQSIDAVDSAMIVSTAFWGSTGFERNRWQTDDGARNQESGD